MRLISYTFVKDFKYVSCLLLWQPSRHLDSEGAESTGVEEHFPINPDLLHVQMYDLPLNIGQYLTKLPCLFVNPSAK